MKKGLIASIDQGTSSTRVVVYDAELRAVRSASRGLKTLAPQPGWLQMDASDILASVDACLEEACSGLDVALVGITNQVTSVFARSSRFFFLSFFLSFFLARDDRCSGHGDWTSACACNSLERHENDRNRGRMEIESSFVECFRTALFAVF
jgi:hypothetical protein